MICAVKALGGSSLTFLDYTDPRIGPEDELYPFTEDLPHLVKQVVDHIKKTNSHVVFTHGSNGEYGHPAHVLCHQAAVSAASHLEITAPHIYTVQAHYTTHPKPRIANKEDAAHMVLDVSTVINIKERAAMCHKTQHALFIRRTSQDLGRQVTIREVLMETEGLHRRLPPPTNDTNDLLFDRLRETGLLIPPTR
jgi:LmbE family N-acetylglucosaminyl deacetylase